ncbi:DNA polymerase ligase N-terminal domain-containing protein [Blastococcus brunescens]|uniref:DNA polymerase ligase N-terminal domain-containing protein n=1 Tax=Blastococcus brunescens TaxID=1564165 RepID=A0ABZ1AV05_9ACTN|nr:DNA polymerase ligase N-terminal domain-containing protein [Blastococcus sp. BMG 8361]WRL61761.1 DNA polymerase ligase N-terminal domain-containing protein [Blastococcus sp. BMG 8361]
MPKGPPTEQGPSRLAVPTEDHPLEYASFAGTIAAGEYGGGHVTIWDAGRYTTEKWDDRHVIVSFDGARMAGRYAMFPVGDGAWNIRKLDDTRPAGAVAEVPLPMLATPGALPTDDEDAAWGYEFKWDGMRAVAAVHGDVLGLTSRKGTDITVRYPEVARLPAALAGHDAVVDGEIVAMDDQGRPDFGALQNRLHRTGAEVPRLAAAKPVTYLVFDLLAWDGEDLSHRPYAERRERLDALGVSGHRWVATPGSVAVGQVCTPRARRTAWRASSPSGWTRPTGPASAAPTGARSRTCAPNRSSSAGGGPGRDDGPGEWAPCCSASPTTRAG